MKNAQKSVKQWKNELVKNTLSTDLFFDIETLGNTVREYLKIRGQPAGVYCSGPIFFGIFLNDFQNMNQENVKHD